MTYQTYQDRVDELVERLAHEIPVKFNAETFDLLQDAIRDLYAHDVLFHAKVCALEKLLLARKVEDTRDAVAWLLALVPVVDQLYPNPTTETEKS